jgi:16S rRNA C967 or C1407 C5-methylase (RsmB/RsmF family)
MHRLSSTAVPWRPQENEENVAYALRSFPELELMPQPDHLRIGSPGLAGCGLDDAQCAMVQRFDPTQPGGDSHIGFFVARFMKRA